MQEDKLHLSDGQSHQLRLEKAATVQTIKDRKLVAMRVEQNKLYYHKMEQALSVVLNGKTRKNDLLAYAKKIIAENGLKIERLMKRSKSVLICWFCEHMDLVPLLSQLIHKQEMVEKYGPAEAFNCSFSFQTPIPKPAISVSTSCQQEPTPIHYEPPPPPMTIQDCFNDLVEFDDEEFKFEIGEDQLIM